MVEGGDQLFILCGEGKPMLRLLLITHLVAAPQVNPAFVGRLDGRINQITDDLVTVAVMPTFFPRRTNSQIICAPVKVLPAPGGP